MTHADHTTSTSAKNAPPTLKRRRKHWTRPLSRRAIAYLQCLADGRDPSSLIRNRSEAGGAYKIWAVLTERSCITRDRQITYRGRLMLMFAETTTHD